MQDLTPGQSIGQRFILVRQLAHEGQMPVWLARIGEGPAQARLRVFPDLNSADLTREIRAEIERAQRVVHPSLCRCMGLFEHEQVPVIAHEYAEDGSDIVSAGKNYRQVLMGLMPVAKGLAYLHDLRLAHGGVSERLLCARGSNEFALDGLGVAWIEAREITGMRADIAAFGAMMGRLTGEHSGTPLPDDLASLLRAMQADSGELTDMHEVVRRLGRVLDIEDKESGRLVAVEGVAGGAVEPLTRGRQAAKSSQDSSAPARPSKPAGVPLMLAVPALLILLLGAVYVMFFMPRPTVESPVVAQSGNGASETAQTAGQSPAAATDGAAPFAAAASARLRQDAQDAAMNLLRSLVALEERGVERWGQEEFAAARLAGDDGDALYRQQEFDEALKRYQEGLQRAESLVGRSGEVLESAIAEGNAAIEAGDGERAMQQFDLALAIDDENPQALAGAARAGKLGEVLEKMRLGGDAEQQGDYVAARTHYQAAVALDENYAVAAEALSRVQGRLGARSFQDLMSRGFRSLDAGDYEDARRRFSQAATMRPAAPGPRDGLAQVDARVRDRDIAARRVAARDAEQKEDWNEAVAMYRAVLQTDSTLVFAREGLARAEQRAALAERMQHYIDEPLRMFENQAYNEARSLLAQARGVAAPGPQHTQQIEALTALVAVAREPVVVELRSDGLTKVSIYKIGEIGQFQQQSVGLIPGRYTAVGSRAGYRDVRREFDVRAGRPPEPVTVVCEDPV